MEFLHIFILTIGRFFNRKTVTLLQRKNILPPHKGMEKRKKRGAYVFLRIQKRRMRNGKTLLL